MSTPADEAPILLSPPHLSGGEQELVARVLAENWVAPAGPWLERFEQAICAVTGSPHCVALSSGTAALHLALRLVGVGPGDLVLSGSMTFVGAVNPIRYLGAEPVFIDGQPGTGNLDPELLREALADLERKHRSPKAVIVTHLYGHAADIGRISEICRERGIALIEDAAEAVGAHCDGRALGAWGDVGVFSFNGNKIVTTGGGGALLTSRPDWAQRALKLATQAREATPWYEHTELGYNYRLSSVLSAVGLGQLAVLSERVARRRAIFRRYAKRLGVLPGVSFPRLAEGDTAWLTTLTFEPKTAGTTPEHVRQHLAAHRIEARPLWKPMHLQPLYQGALCYGGAVTRRLFETGLCLPSGSALTEAQIDRVAGLVEACLRG